MTALFPPEREPYQLGEMPLGRPMETVDERLVRAPSQTIFEIAREVELWPGYLPHYRWVRFHERARDGGGLVEMSAWRPFGPVGWPTWWLSEMAVDASRPTIRFRHIRGVTAGMDVEWTFTPEADGTRVRIVHAWDGPRWPLIGVLAATTVIGPVFIHGIAQRTLHGLAHIAERNELRGSGLEQRGSGLEQRGSGLEQRGSGFGVQGSGTANDEGGGHGGGR